MKKLLFISILISNFNIFSQSKVDGLISINKYSGKIISNYNGEYFWVLHNSKINIINNKGEVMYKNITPKDSYKVNLNINNGIIYDFDKTKFAGKFISLTSKKKLSEAVYTEVIPYDNGTYFAVKKLNKKTTYEYLDKNLNVIHKIDPNLVIKKLKLSSFQSMGYASFSSTKKYREFFGSFNDGFAKYYNPASKKFGIINVNGKKILPETYKKMGDFSEGLAFFKNKDNLYGFLNTKGKIVIPPIYSKQPYSFSSNRAKVLSKDGFFGFIDSKNNLIIDAKYKYATNFYKNHALVKESKMSPLLLIDATGKTIATFSKDYKVNFQEQANTHQTLGLFPEYLTHINSSLKQFVDFKKGILLNRFNRYGLVSINGNVILDFKYTSLKDFNNGLMLAIFKDDNKKDKQGLINEQGKMVVEIGLSKF